jgi:hypothetical protein
MELARPTINVNIEEQSFYLVGNIPRLHYKDNRLMVLREITTVYSGNNMKSINTLYAERRVLISK